MLSVLYFLSQTHIINYASKHCRSSTVLYFFNNSWLKDGKAWTHWPVPFVASETDYMQNGASDNCKWSPSKDWDMLLFELLFLLHNMYDGLTYPQYSAANYFLLTTAMFSHSLCVGSFQVFWTPPTVEQHAGQVGSGSQQASGSNASFMALYIFRQVAAFNSNLATNHCVATALKGIWSDLTLLPWHKDNVCKSMHHTVISVKAKITLSTI